MEKNRKRITKDIFGTNAVVANSITVSRMLFSLALLVLPSRSLPFAVLYLLCGLTDVLDGFIARKLHTESENGAMLDSIADLLFTAVYAVKILPILKLPLWIWIWTAIIAVTKIICIVIASKKTHRLEIEHSFGNKLTGLLLFLLPLSVCAADGKYGAILVCIAATVTVIIEVFNAVQDLNLCAGKPELRCNHHSASWIYRSTERRLFVQCFENTLNAVRRWRI